MGTTDPLDIAQDRENERQAAAACIRIDDVIRQINFEMELELLDAIECEDCDRVLKILRKAQDSAVKSFIDSLGNGYVMAGS